MMRKLSVKPKRRGTKPLPIDDDIRYDDARRLRNALLALAKTDPGWMSWVERNIPRNAPFLWKRRIIERQARLIIANRYRATIGRASWLSLVYSDYCFEDDGSLRTYL